MTANLTVPTALVPTAHDEAALRVQAEQVLGRLVGPGARLREDQWAAIRALVVERRRVQLVQRTGWGKSAVYWVATALLRGQGGGPSLVISPLLALMRDQVAAAERAGLVARTLNSANAEEWPAIERAVLENQVDVLLVSPERLNSAAGGWRERVLPALTGRLALGMLTIDEAHCISAWGHDFRPDYRRVADVLAGLPAGTPVLATTATANARVSADIATQIGTDTVTLRGSLDRASLRLAVVPTPDVATAYGFIADALDELAGSGIVYALTVAETERLAGFLAARGHPVAAYSSATAPERRAELEAALMANKVKALVATSSLGMGLDKPDLAFVVHLGAPAGAIAYYQQVGRAGRALPDAVGLCLPTAADEAIWRWYETTRLPDEPVVRRVLDALGGEAERPLSLPALEKATDLRRTRLETLLTILDVDGAVCRAPGGYRLTGADWHYDAERYAAVHSARRAERATMRRYLAARSCLMRTLRGALDDPQAADCGRCSVCTGTLPVLPGGPKLSTVAAARTYLRGVDNVLEPRRQWPLGAARRGRIPEELRAEPGRALARAEDPAWGPAVAGALASDVAPPAELLDGCVAVLARWGWPAGRPVAVVAMPSRRHPVLVRALAGRLAAVGPLPVVEALSLLDDGAFQEEAPTNQRAADGALGRLRLTGEVPSGPVLLIDDVAHSGFTLAVAAVLLREAGAGPVYPLVLHKNRVVVT